MTWKDLRWFPGLRGWHVYLAVLAASQLWLLVGIRQAPAGPARPSVELARQGARGPVGGEPVRVAFHDSGAGPAVIYLHGSPGSGADARHLARLLAGRYRVIAPDLPGFGASSRRLPDYGIEAHARYVLELMDRLGIERAHFMAHSMGSGVAFHVASTAPERVASITSYAGIGVQEGEGSGDYHLEHLKYAVGYALLVVAPELVPHFGLLGPRGARHAFIRNFWDTDQRPLRAILKSLESPLLILHGRDDPLVPLWGAEEHHRIVEHSELVILDASHFLVFSRHGSERLAAEMLPFLTRHDDPRARPQRRFTDRSGGPRPGAPLPTPLDLQQGIGPWAQIAALFAGTFVSEDLTCISAGLLVRQGQVDFFVALVGCLLGIFVSDIWLWSMGRLFGRRALGWRWIASRVPRARVDRFGDTFDRHLGKAVLASRFLPGTRLPMYVAAGTVSRRPAAFFGWLLVAAALWTPALVLLAVIFGPVVARPFEALFGIGWFAWVAAALSLFLLVRTAMLALSWRGRVRLRARVSRIWRWEFWPVWLFYLPVYVWIAILALRHRGLTVPTAANPALPHAGFVGESKSDIQSRLPEDWIVPGCAVPPGELTARMAALRGRAKSAGWALPLVLKPDQGQRGFGLKLARDWDEIEAYLAAQPRTVLAQTYDPGPHEAGVFYYRIPGERSGRIFSITHKRFPQVVGDGKTTLEDLILLDPRLRMQAAIFMRRWAGRLFEIPADGERVRLAVAGNHCQGTMFLDGAQLITAELEQAFDRIGRSFEGFYFGRFDVRYGEVDAFKAGRGFRIVELNGVTSESTNIYDPSFGLLRAYRTLFRQWSLAFRIGAVNRARGHAVSSPAALLRETWQHYHESNASTLAD